MTSLPPTLTHVIPDYLTLIPWCGLFILATYLVYSGWTQARTERTPQARQVHDHRDYGVASGTPVPTNDHDVSALPEDEAHDARNGRRPTSKGRQFSAATAPNHGPSSYFNEPSARVTLSLIGGDQNECNDHVTDGLASRSSSSHILSTTVQAPRLHLEPLADLPWTQAAIRISSASSTAKRAWSTPVPALSLATHGRNPSRNGSLPHDPKYERMPPRPTKVAPLKTALYAGSKDLAPPPGIQWFILFVAVNIDENSEHNLRCFQEMLKQTTPESNSIYFDSLAGLDATPDKITARLTSLYLRAGCVSDDSLVFVFLTGTGDETNRMRLLNGNVLTEDNIRGCISDVQARSGLTNVRTVPVIFDICRMNKNVPSVEMCQLVEMMWSCSLGQQAQALGFSSDAPTVPNSCFLLALFWTAYDISNSSSSDFQKAFSFRLEQLIRMRRYSHDYWLWEEGKCDDCGVGSPCTPPGPQDPKGQQAGWDAIASLGALIMARYPEYVRNVVTVLTEEMRHCESWEVNNRASSLVKEEHRGATQHVAAGSVRDVVL